MAKSTSNERITEDFVREHFKRDKMFTEIQIEEQKSQNPIIQKLLKTASKKGSGIGKPEFIITHEQHRELLIVVECKADTQKHESDTRDKYDKFAVDGVLLYSAYFSKEFDVLSIAVSGQTKDELKVTHFYQKKGEKEPKMIFGSELLPMEDYIGGLLQDEEKRKEKYEDLLDYSKKLNAYLRKYKIKEDKRSLLLSGILLALADGSFYRTYKDMDAKPLAHFLISTIKSQLKAEEEKSTSGVINISYDFISTYSKLTKKGSNILKNLITDIDNNINSYARTYRYYDIIGQFYIEFLKYSNAEKGLGIVLTPPHITEFFSDIVDIKPEDRVYDNCTGTSGFLVSAMKAMIQKCDGNKRKEQKVKMENLIGVESQPEIYPLAVSNMFLHGDGRSNIIEADCLDDETVSKIKILEPNIGFLNPPYKSKNAQKKGDYEEEYIEENEEYGDEVEDDIEEFEFILKNLECLKKHGQCVAIIPMSCVLAQSGNRLKLKESLMKKHTIRAVFSMPDDLFHNSKAKVVSVIIVIEAHRPHTKNDYTFFGYFKDDGFTIEKTKGRFDYDKKWESIKAHWLDVYNKKETVQGLSVVRKIVAKDEWCADAYMEIVYDDIVEGEYIGAMAKYAASKFLMEAEHKQASGEKAKFELANWEEFAVGEIFDLTRGVNIPKRKRQKGNIPYISGSKFNNGLMDVIEPKNLAERERIKRNAITINNNGSVGYCFYHGYEFIASDSATVIEIKDKSIEMNAHIGMFLKILFEKIGKKYSYGRKIADPKLKSEIIKLPANDKGEPDWAFMEAYIKSLPYSKNI